MIVLLTISGCGDRSDDAHGDGASQQPSLVDAAGRTVSLTAPVRRVVSLVPSATETLRAIGADTLLVGRTDYDTQPWIADLPTVGGGLDPNLEVLVSLRPDLVVRFEGEQDPTTPDRLDELGIRHLAVRPDRLDDIYRTATLLGLVTGHRVQSDSLVGALRSGLQDLSASVPGGSPPRVAYVLGGSPPWVAGPGTYIDEIIELLGGTNVFSDLTTLYAAISTEALRAREIDVVLTPEAGSVDPTLTPGARIEEVGDRLEIPGPSVLAAAAFIASLLYPEHEE